MVVKLMHYILGYVLLEVVGDSPERFVNMCAHHNIKLWELQSETGKIRFKINIRDLQYLKPILKKTRMTFTIKSKYGLPFIFGKIMRRPCTIPGILLVILISYIYTFFIWDIKIEGNVQYSSEEIMEFLNEEELYKSMPIARIDTGEIAYKIRGYFPNIIWVSVHVEGTSIRVNVKENQQIDREKSLNVNLEVGIDENNVVSKVEGRDLVAQCDGRIVSIVTREGIPQVHKGDYVSKGDILITGRIPLTSDYDEPLGYNYVTADGDIIIETIELYEDEQARKYDNKVYDENTSYRCYIKVGNYLIGNMEKVISSGEYESVTKEYILHPSMQNKYTFIFAIQTNKTYEFVEEYYTTDELKNILNDRFVQHIKNMDEKKVEIIENNVKIEVSEEEAVASGELILHVYSTDTAATEILEVVKQGTEDEE